MIVDSKETVSSRYNRTDAHMHSETAVNTQDLHRFKPDGVTALKGERIQSIPPLTNKVFSIEDLKTKRNISFL